MTSQDAASRIYAAAISGNDVNPGVPEAIAQFMVGQAGNETGGFSSNFFVNNNNCFGYSCDSGSKWQNGCSSGNADNGVQVGNYDSIEDSTQEMVDWLWRRTRDGRGGFPPDLNQITDANAYAQALSDAGYFTSNAATYGNNIAKWITRLGDFFHPR